MRISIELNEEEAVCLKILAFEEKRTPRAQAEWVLGRQLLEIFEKREMGEHVILHIGNILPMPEECPTVDVRDANPVGEGQRLGEGEKEAQIGA